MSDDTTALDVTDDAATGRFEARMYGTLAGSVLYYRRGDRVVFTHTEVDKAFEGRGVGSALARGALDLVRNRGDRAVPLCPFMASFIDRHEEYADLVDRDMLAELSSPR